MGVLKQVIKASKAQRKATINKEDGLALSLDDAVTLRHFANFKKGYDSKAIGAIIKISLLLTYEEQKILYSALPYTPESTSVLIGNLKRFKTLLENRDFKRDVLGLSRLMAYRLLDKCLGKPTLRRALRASYWRLSLLQHREYAMSLHPDEALKRGTTAVLRYYLTGQVPDIGHSRYARPYSTTKHWNLKSIKYIWSTYVHLGSVSTFHNEEESFASTVRLSRVYLNDKVSIAKRIKDYGTSHDAGQFPLPAKELTLLWGPWLDRHASLWEYSAHLDKIEEALQYKLPKSKAEFLDALDSYYDAVPSGDLLKLGIPRFRVDDYEELRKTPPPKKILDLEPITHDDLTLRQLEPDDIRGPAIGLLSGCCQHLHGVARECAVSSWKRSDCSVWVIENKKGEVIAQSFVWLGVKDRKKESVYTDVVIDSIEASLKYKKQASRYPSFKSKYSNRRSAWYRIAAGVSSLKGNMLTVPGLGPVALVLHREILGDFTSATIIQDPDGRYYASIPMKNTRISAKRSVISEDEVVGLDAGIKDLLTTSDDTVIASLEHLDKHDKLIKKRQRKLSRCVKGSSGYARARILLGRAYSKLSRYRTHCLHVISSQLAKKYKTIVIEDLDIKRMMANKHLARLIARASWATLYNMLAYKLQATGGYLFQAGRYFASSKICNACGDKNHALQLSDRIWTCQSCDTTHDRDKNAANNLRDLGRSFVRSYNDKIGVLKITPSYA